MSQSIREKLRPYSDRALCHGRNDDLHAYSASGHPAVYTEADGIITDNVSQAVRLITELEQRSDLDRMIDKIKTVF